MVFMYTANLHQAHASAPGGGLEYTPEAGEDASFSFGGAPLSVVELCVRHQYCDAAKGRAKRLLDEARPPPPGTPEAALVARLKRGDASGIEAHTQLFLA